MITFGILVHSLLNETGSDGLIQIGMALYERSVLVATTAETAAVCRQVLVRKLPFELAATPQTPTDGKNQSSHKTVSTVAFTIDKDQSS